MLKVIIILNWIAIGLLTLLVGAETLFPTKGGDAAGRGIGQAIYLLAVIALVVLLVLNLLPYALSKYIAFVLVAIPTLWVTVAPSIKRFGQGVWGNLTAEPFFKDPEQERIAMAVFNGNADKVKKLLQTPLPRLSEAEFGYPLLEVAIQSAIKFSDKKAEREECLLLLLQAGTPILSADPEQDAPQIGVVSMGNPDVLKILLEHGADPNAKSHDASIDQANAVPMIFEAMSTYYGARDCVRLLLDHGADPNAIKPRDGDNLAPSILMFAAERQRWDICLMLMDKGADVHYQTPDGQSLKTWVEAAEKNFQGDEYSTMKDFERVKSAVAG